MLNRIKNLPRPFKWMILSLLVLIHIIPFFFVARFFPWEESNPSLKYYPLHPEYIFSAADSYISVKNPEEHKYTIRLDTVSQTNKVAFLRQDISLYFQDGVLIEMSYGWKENVDTLIHRIEVPGKYNHLFQAITYHHAEFHEQQEGKEIITSQQAMSYDYLYVTSSKYGGNHHFHHPETDRQMRWKEVIDRSINQQLRYEWKQAMEQFDIHPDQYYMIPFVQLAFYGDKDDLPGIPGDNQASVIGNIWEGLYRHYVLGFTGKTGVSVNPVGSSMPLILINKEGNHLRIIYRTADGAYHQLYQEVQS